MSSINTQNTQYVYVANASDRIQIFNQSGTEVTTAITDNNTIVRIKFTTPGGTVRYSPFFKFGDLSNKIKVDTSALTEQVSYLGYNTTSGSLDSTADKYFGIKINLDHQTNIGNNSPEVETIPAYSATASQEELAKTLMIEAIANKNISKFIKVDRVSNGTITEFTNDVTVVNGGKSVTCTSHGASAGSFVRIQGATYKIDSVTTNAFVLDVAYQGESETIDVSATTDLAGTLASVTNWGIRFVGTTPVDTFKPAQNTPFVVRFSIEAPEFDTATVTYSTRPSIGIGTYQQIAFLESRAQFEERDRYVQAYPPNERDINAISTNSYDCISFIASDNTYTSPTTGVNPVSLYSFLLAFESSLNYDGVDTVLVV